MEDTVFLVKKLDSILIDTVPIVTYNLSDMLSSIITIGRDRRSELLAKWRAKGGVFIIGYAAFRNLSFGKHVKDRQMAREICHALQVLFSL